MRRLSIPLGYDHVRAVKGVIKKRTEEIGDSLQHTMESHACRRLAEQVKENIARIPDVDGNYKGSENPEASVFVVTRLDGGHEVHWRGRQIAYLEFGTGAAGAAGGYPSHILAETSYKPNPAKERWLYKDDKDDTLRWSHGLTPQAPMYKAALWFRTNDRFKSVRWIVRRWVNAFHL